MSAELKPISLNAAKPKKRGRFALLALLGAALPASAWLLYRAHPGGLRAASASAEARAVRAVRAAHPAAAAPSFAPLGAAAANETVSTEEIRRAPLRDPDSVAAAEAASGGAHGRAAARTASRGNIAAAPAAVSAAASVAASAPAPAFSADEGGPISESGLTYAPVPDQTAPPPAAEERARAAAAAAPGPAVSGASAGSARAAAPGAKSSKASAAAGRAPVLHIGRAGHAKGFAALFGGVGRGFGARLRGGARGAAGTGGGRIGGAGGPGGARGAPAAGGDVSFDGGAGDGAAGGTPGRLTRFSRGAPRLGDGEGGDGAGEEGGEDPQARMRGGKSRYTDLKRLWGMNSAAAGARGGSAENGAGILDGEWSGHGARSRVLEGQGPGGRRAPAQDGAGAPPGDDEGRAIDDGGPTLGDVLAQMQTPEGVADKPDYVKKLELAQKLMAAAGKLISISSLMVFAGKLLLKTLWGASAGAAMIATGMGMAAAAAGLAGTATAIGAYLLMTSHQKLESAIVTASALALTIGAVKAAQGDKAAYSAAKAQINGVETAATKTILSVVPRDYLAALRTTANLAMPDGKAKTYMNGAFGLYDGISGLAAGGGGLAALRAGLGLAQTATAIVPIKGKAGEILNLGLTGLQIATDMWPTKPKGEAPGTAGEPDPEEDGAAEAIAGSGAVRDDGSPVGGTPEELAAAAVPDVPLDPRLSQPTVAQIAEINPPGNATVTTEVTSARLPDGTAIDPSQIGTNIVRPDLSSLPLNTRPLVNLLPDLSGYTGFGSPDVPLTIMPPMPVSLPAPDQLPGYVPLDPRLSQPAVAQVAVINAPGNASVDAFNTSAKLPNGQPVPVIGGSLSTPVVQTMESPTLAWRNNNPGNINGGKWANAHGATGTDKYGYAIFPDADAGRAALNSLLNTNTYQSMSLTKAINTYAPTNDPRGVNDPNGYIKFVSTKAGVDPTTKLKDMTADQLAALQKWITVMEGYHPPKPIVPKPAPKPVAPKPTGH